MFSLLNPYLLLFFLYTISLTSILSLLSISFFLSIILFLSIVSFPIQKFCFPFFPFTSEVARSPFRLALLFFSFFRCLATSRLFLLTSLFITLIFFMSLLFSSFSFHSYIISVYLSHSLTTRNLYFCLSTPLFACYLRCSHIHLPLLAVRKRKSNLEMNLYIKLFMYFGYLNAKLLTNKIITDNYYKCYPETGYCRK